MNDRPVLIVEDSLIQEELLRRILAREGYRVVAAKDGAAGLAAARKERPRIIISDIAMPVMDGYAMCRAVREDDALMDIPVILLTTLSDAGDVIRGLNAGADYYVTKPYDEQYLLSRIKAALTAKPWRGEEKVEMEVALDGEKHRVSAGRRQILNLLVSTYENAVLQNRELAAAQEQLRKHGELLERQEQDLKEINKELEAFSYSVSHDLRAPLRAIDGFSQALLEDCAESLDARGKGHLARVREAVGRMGLLIDDLLGLFRITRAKFKRERVDLTSLAESVARAQGEAEPGRKVAFRAEPGLTAEGDPVLLRSVLENLIGNAWKFTARTPEPAVEFGSRPGENGRRVYFVKDNGAGFDMAHADKLFVAFQRLHAGGEFPGTGIGLAAVKRIVARHRGRVWAEGVVGRGATVSFTLGNPISELPTQTTPD